MDYKASGVDIDAGNETVRRIKGLARSTFTSGVLSEIGSFGGLFRVDPARFADPVLVASADGVGTKLKVAFLANRHDTVGEDLVNHCVNDILVQGARPLFFLDYLATGRLAPDVAEQVVAGIARGCRANGCALLGGETAEMPGFYADGEYDLAGFIVGAVDHGAVIDGSSLAPGDALIGLGSSGLHTNGYSLARRIVFDELRLRVDSYVAELGTTVGDALLAVHRSYLDVLEPHLAEPGVVRGLAHITGGGITDNLPRIFPDGIGAVINRAAWTVPALFQFLEAAGHVPIDDMYRTFNMGIGLILACRPSEMDRLLTSLRKQGEQPRVIGELVALVPGERKVGVPVTRNLGVLISGRGSNLQAIIDAIEAETLDARIAVVISNVPGVQGIERAGRAGIETLFVSHKAYPSREEYDRAVVAELRARQVGLVCLAGFMRLLSAAFVDAFPNAILNIHPALLPAFPGTHAQRQALEHGAKVAGATVHIVDCCLDAGPIVLQRCVPVMDDDTEETLSERILAVEHQLYPEAIRLMLDGGWRVEGRRFLRSSRPTV